jgi:hypothetical protein
MGITLGLNAKEKAALDRDGFVCRNSAFDAAELASIARSCEELIETLLEVHRRPKVTAGAYVFENGCLEVVPGSHRNGEAPRKAIDGFGANEMDESAFKGKLVPLEVPAGSVVYFGSLLIHASAPNRTAGDRRALLYSYQPAGRRTLRDAVFGKTDAKPARPAR